MDLVFSSLKSVMHLWCERDLIPSLQDNNKRLDQYLD
jgi:hypothetical protein